MFKKKKKIDSKKNYVKPKQNNSVTKTYSKLKFATVIEKGISIEGGTLKGNGNVRIDGYYVGDIDTQGTVMIGASGAVYGDINASSAIIAGNCKGNIRTAICIHMTSTGVVEGTLECKSIIIDENAIFNGICKMESHVQLPSKEQVLCLNDTTSLSSDMTLVKTHTMM